MDFDVVKQNLSTANLDRVKQKSLDPDKEKKLKDAAAGFESIMITTMLKSMRTSLPGNALFKETNATDIYRSMQDQHLSDHLSKGASIGIKEFLYDQLKDSE